MSGKIVNLRAARKAKARGDKKARADANAAKHGRTKAERERQASEEALAARRLDGHKRDDEA